MKNRLADAEKRASQAHQKSSKLQSDYQSLLEITTDLVDTLEAALRGDHIEGNVLQEICSRLVASQRGSSVRPADSLDDGRTFAEAIQTAKTDGAFSYGNTLRQSLRSRPSNFGPNLQTDQRFSRFLNYSNLFL